MIKDATHFKGNNLSRSENVQRLVTQLILDSKISDEERENSKIWELKHHAGTVQIGRILAIKRGLNIELAELICALHDIYPIVTGKYKDHAKLGGEMAKKILHDSHDFTDVEMKTICQAIAAHSSKDTVDDDPYMELAKDADAFECSLYEGAEGFYSLHKPERVFLKYAERIKNVRAELGLPVTDIFR
jgi:uncharacterized protein